jgi:hypothetical protein
MGKLKDLGWVEIEVKYDNHTYRHRVHVGRDADWKPTPEPGALVQAGMKTMQAMVDSVEHAKRKKVQA